MLKLQGVNELRKFFEYYKMYEKPHMNIVKFFEQLDNKNLLGNVQITFSEEQKLTTNKVFIFPNGTIIWKDMNTFDNIVDDCLDFISKNKNNSMIMLQLHSRQLERHEEQKRNKVLENVTMGQYALELSRLEREDRKLVEQYQNWEKHLSVLKREKIDDVLDRYNIQKQLFDVFKDEKYKKNMDKWKSVFNQISKL